MHNTLIRDDSIYPVDWETAAIALGEIDLAFLTDGWSADVVQACERAYQQARWPTGAPEGYERRLAAARLYMQFLWLGCKPEITLGRGIRWRFKLLCSAGERLGLI